MELFVFGLIRALRILAQRRNKNDETPFFKREIAQTKQLATCLH